MIPSIPNVGSDGLEVTGIGGFFPVFFYFGRSFLQGKTMMVSP